MKLNVLLCFLLGAFSASAQTNAPIKTAITNRVVSTNRPKAIYAAPAQTIFLPGYAALASISNQIARIEVQKKDLREKSQIEDKRYSLRSAAGQSNRSDADSNYQREQAVNRQFAAYERQIAALRLKEFEIRQTYKIPEPNAERKKR